MRVLVLSRGVGWSKDEGGEVTAFLEGLLQLEDRALVVRASDGETTFRPSLDGAGGVVLEPRGGVDEVLTAPPDVVWSHLVLDAKVLTVAMRLRAKGVPGVITPMGMLGDDFAATSWFRESDMLRRLLKPVGVRALRSAWHLAATRVHVAGAHEARMAGIDPAATLRSPLPYPASPLATAVSEHAADLPGDDERPPPGPVALVSRFDVHRKGFDRLAAWLEAHADDLPRPAVLLLASHDPDPPEAIAKLVADGLVEWDTTTRGADLLPRLLACRAMILLTRFEAQPRALREAAIAGVPVITTPEANWSEAAAAIGTGLVVDGDDPAAVQHAFEQAPSLPRRGGTARALLDRRRLAAFHRDALREIADGHHPAVLDDYAAFARSEGAASEGTG